MRYELNAGADRLCQQLFTQADHLRIGGQPTEVGAHVCDLGIEVPGGLEAGCRLAQICLAGLGRVELVPGDPRAWPGVAVAVRTDHPVAACMASQYAGWQITGNDGYFAMGSGPMRAAAGREALLQAIGLRESPEMAVGVLESRRLPPAAVCAQIADACGVDPTRLTLLVAPTASLSGTIQIVARTVETALHKLFQLEFDVARVVSGFGLAPLPPVAGDDLAAIGRTNDAVLYGGQVTLWVRGDDASLAAVVNKVPSQASTDYGQPFSQIFERYERDFYRIDPHLFSPAEITLINLDTGRMFRAGQTAPDVLRGSFEG
jgi:methenyltetrahydromethanopterin cyclohydrolase